jgi:hypothetical protein
MYGRRASQLLKELDACEPGQLVVFNVILLLLSPYPLAPPSSVSGWTVLKFPRFVCLRDQFCLICLC